MCQMVRHEMKSLPQRAPQKLFGSTLHLTETQLEGCLHLRIPPLGAISFSAQLRVKRIGDMIDIARVKACVFQAKADRAFRELMRVIPVRHLAVLDAIEPL